MLNQPSRLPAPAMSSARLRFKCVASIGRTHTRETEWHYAGGLRDQPVIVFAGAGVKEEVARGQLKHHAGQRPHVSWRGVFSAKKHLHSIE